VEKSLFTWKKIKLPTIAFAIYILLIPFESILYTKIIVRVSYATIAAVITSLMVLIYLLFKPKLVRLTKSAVPWVAYFLWAGLSIYWSIDRSLSGYNFIYISKHIFFFLLICSYPFSHLEKRFIRHTVILSGILLSVTVLLTSFYFGEASSFIRATIANGYYKADPNHTASSLLIPISFLVVDFVEAKKFKPLDAVAIVVFVFTLVVSGSRGASLAFLASIVTLTIIYRHFKNLKKIMLAIVFSLAILIAIIFAYNPSTVNRYAKIENLDRYSSERILVWKDALSFYKNKPFAGYGFDVYPVLPSDMAHKVKSAHNIFIQSLVEGGAVSFLLILVGVIPMIMFKTTDSFSRASKAGIIGIFATSLFLFTLNYDYFWLAMMFGEISNRSNIRRKKIEEIKTAEASLKPKLSLDIR
jgi:O-antigen ligase